MKMKQSTKGWILFNGAIILFAIAYQFQQPPLAIIGFGWLIASIIIGIGTMDV